MEPQAKRRKPNSDARPSAQIQQELFPNHVGQPCFNFQGQGQEIASPHKRSSHLWPPLQAQENLTFPGREESIQGPANGNELLPYQETASESFDFWTDQSFFAIDVPSYQTQSVEIPAVELEQHGAKKDSGKSSYKFLSKRLIKIREQANHNGAIGTMYSYRTSKRS